MLFVLCPWKQIHLKSFWVTIFQLFNKRLAKIYQGIFRSRAPWGGLGFQKGVCRLIFYFFFYKKKSLRIKMGTLLATFQRRAGMGVAVGATLWMC
jgi:hypothetical protein